ncbi:MAG: hypothetical protein HN855_16600 [Anaerolineae bacterium]|jgi:hypothetical protein|nr:hypothetical protein [Anaerolineae bacterium]MBT7072120.1 hypothetical protein [Anaerolineae bacterium]MBT7326769.1 hypothetical protein [Anaerolineae bacterium]
MDEKNIIPRIGTFFLVVGVGFIILFVVSDLAQTVYFDYLFIGLLFAGFGIFLRRKADPPPPSGRFATWRKMRKKEKKNKD